MADTVTVVKKLPVLKKRSPTMHKGESGRLFCVAGSVGMVGAAALASRAALRCGAGLALAWVITSVPEPTAAPEPPPAPEPARLPIAAEAEVFPQWTRFFEEDLGIAADWEKLRRR